jgi:hypothetical protein
MRSESVSAARRPTATGLHTVRTQGLTQMPSRLPTFMFKKTSAREEAYALR